MTFAAFAVASAAACSALLLLPWSSVPAFSESTGPLLQSSHAEPDLRRKIGQMLIVGFEGTRPEQRWPRLVQEQIERGAIGGVLYLQRNIGSGEDVRALNRAFLEAGGAIPPFIAVDQEGGRVQRLPERIGFPQIPSARTLARMGNAAEARPAFAAVAGALAELGFNLNLGPDVDLDVQPSNHIIAGLGRSFSHDPELVSAFASEFVEAHRKAGVLTTLKHFPGHGSSIEDSHLALPDISGTWSPAELIPFRKLISVGLADSVMVGHLALQRGPVGNEARIPATLSHGIVTRLLREELGYDGLIIADDAEMAAVAHGRDREQVIIGMIRAGIDLVVLANVKAPDPALPDDIVAALAREAIRDGEFRGMIERAYGRIITLKGTRL